MADTKLNGNQLNVEFGYSNFTLRNYMNAATACPSSYTTARCFVHSKSAQGTVPSEGYGQVLLSTTNDSASPVGFAGPGNSIELWNGSTNTRGTYTLTADQKDYWFMTDILSDQTANLYYIVDSDYTYETLPTNTSDWTLGVSCSNFSLASKTLQVGRANQSFAPESSIILDVKVLFDNVLTYDLQNPSHFI